MSEYDFTLRADTKSRTLVIQGVGLIGGSLGMAAKSASLVSEVVGVGRDASRLQRAVDLGAIDRYIVASDADLAYPASIADIYLIATPVPNILRDLPIILGSAKPDSVITDVGSVKKPVVDAADGDPRFVGSHPMAGSEHGGIEHAQSDLFQGAMWALTPTFETSEHAFTVIESLATGVGAVTRTLGAESHDNAVAVTSHLPHILAYTLMAMAADEATANPDLAHLSAGSFASATRVAGSLPSLWQGISIENKTALSAALTKYRQRLDNVQKALDVGDASAIMDIFSEGYEARLSWPGK